MLFYLLMIIYIIFSACPLFIKFFLTLSQKDLEAHQYFNSSAIVNCACMRVFLYIDVYIREVLS